MVDSEPEPETWRVEMDKEEILVVNLSGRGDKDMDSVTKYLDAKENA